MVEEIKERAPISIESNNIVKYNSGSHNIYINNVSEES